MKRGEGVHDLVGADEAMRVVRTYGNLLLRIALHYTGNRADAEDIVQEVFMRWAEKCPEYNDTEHEKAWFIRVAVNLCKNHLRSFWVKKNTLTGDELPSCTTEQEYALLDLVRQLPEKYRMVIYLHYYEGYPLVEIAAILSKKVSTVQTWHLRAKSLLKTMIGENDDALGII